MASARIPREYVESFQRHNRELCRTMARLAASFRLAADAIVRADRHEWEHPELLLEAADHEILEMQSFGRTLEAIDDLPTA